MGGRVAVCVEEEACKNPQIIGLEGERFDSQSWLEVYTSGEETRRSFAAGDGAKELWVVSCDDVEPINLAATIKADRPDSTVRLVTSEACGSLFSRAHAAGIDEVIDFRAFLNRYAQAKKLQGDLPGSADGGASKEKRGEITDNPIAGEAANGAGDAAAVQANTVEAGTKPRISTVDEDRAEDALPLGEPGAYGMEHEEGQPSFMRVEDTVVERTGPVELVVSGRAEPTSTAQLIQVQPVTALAATAIDSRSFVITVVSGSGGAGKSAVSALGALIASRWGYKTLLLDCDLQFGDAAFMVGAEDPLCVDEALLHPERLEIEAAQAKPLSVLAAPTRLEASEEVVRQLPGLLDAVSGKFEVVVVNTGASWAEQHAVLLERSSVALFLVDQRVSSVRACRHALELCARCGIAATPFQYALNRCAKGAPLSTIDVSSALQGVPVFELKDGGRDVEDYLSGGGARELIESRNEFVKSLERMLERLLPGGVRVVPGPEKAPDEKRPFRRRMRHAAGKRGKR